MIRVAIAGYGAVAAIHARRLELPAQATAVFGPNKEKAERFAAAHGIPNAVTSWEAALESADAAIICSPSPCHYEQARAALEAGLHVLVELPACDGLAEARKLHALALKLGLRLHCAHTSRHLAPYARLGLWLSEGVLGAIEQVYYLRSIPPRKRSWTDDALLHHAGHPLDLFLNWFGALRPLSCAAHPQARQAQNLAVLGELESGAPVTVAISYTARVPEVRMTLAGSSHTVLTDGFSYIRSDLADLCWEGDGEDTYERAIQEQDRAFLAGAGVPWDETVRLAALIDDFRALWRVPR
jgi:2-hydroxy-4-carboxymuconate semialdehyde hemiacetal dehydrogenase